MSNDRNHFEEYREQTRVKHEILEKYLRAYLHVLKRWNDNLLFIDGFAGPGAYQNNGSSQPGSPIRALSLIPSDAELAKRVTTIFIEKARKMGIFFRFKLCCHFIHHNNSYCLILFTF